MVLSGPHGPYMGLSKRLALAMKVHSQQMYCCDCTVIELVISTCVHPRVACALPVASLHVDACAMLQCEGEDAIGDGHLHRRSTHRPCLEASSETACVSFLCMLPVFG